MRILLCGIVLLGLTAAAHAADIPDPPACADYFKHDADLHSCDAAITRESDPIAKSILLLRRAYMNDEAGDVKKFDGALSDLDEAIALWPQNAGAWHERAYLHDEIGDSDKAEADLDEEAKLTPDRPQVYQERAFARLLRGNLQGSFEDSDRWARLETTDGIAQAGRARALMWLGRFDDASKALDDADALAKSSGNMASAAWIKRQREDFKRWTAWGDPAQAAKICEAAQSEADFLDGAFIGNCTRAFLDGKTAKDKADALTQRATAMELVSQRRSAALDDFRLAAMIEPTNPDRLFNLGSWLVGMGRAREAMRYLDASIAAKPDYYNYAARSSARYDLADYNGAFADAKKSFETKPNELALTVLGDLLYDKQDAAAAKSYWVAAYHLGDRDDGLKARLAKIGVSWPPPDDPPAK